jgi:hypothetical protein
MKNISGISNLSRWPVEMVGDNFFDPGRTLDVCLGKTGCRIFGRMFLYFCFGLLTLIILSGGIK